MRVALVIARAFPWLWFLSLFIVGFGRSGAITLTGKEKATDENGAENGNTKRKFEQFCSFHGCNYLEREGDIFSDWRAFTMPPIIMMAMSKMPPIAWIIDAFSIFNSKIKMSHNIFLVEDLNQRVPLFALIRPMAKIANISPDPTAAWIHVVVSIVSSVCKLWNWILSHVRSFVAHGWQKNCRINVKNGPILTNSGFLLHLNDLGKCEKVRKVNYFFSKRCNLSSEAQPCWLRNVRLKTILS